MISASSVKTRAFWRRALPAWLKGSLLGAACALLLLCFGNFREIIEQSTFDTLLHLRGIRYPNKAVAVVFVDQATVDHYNDWPLPRSAYATAIRRLTKAGAKTIAFDILFSAGSNSARDDADFAAACAQSHRVVQAAVLIVPRPNDDSAMATGASYHKLQPRFALADHNAQCAEANWGTTAEDSLMAGSVGMGHVTTFPEWDGTFRNIPNIIRYHGRVYPSLALAAAANFLDQRPSQVVAEPGTVLSLIHI